MSEQTEAEDMIDLARAIIPPRGELMLADGIEADCAFLSYVALSIKFDRLPPAMKLRAIYERWDQRRIVREMY